MGWDGITSTPRNGVDAELPPTRGMEAKCQYNGIRNFIRAKAHRCVAVPCAVASSLKDTTTPRAIQG